MRRVLLPAVALALVATVGGCGQKATSCPAGLTACASTCAAPPGFSALCTACVDLGADGANCGACGASCGAGTTCAGGKCESLCAADRIECGGACVAYLTDLGNCGACGRACDGGTVCHAGKCEPACAPLLTRCGTGSTATCADLSTDRSHCGDCATACGAGTVCDGGTCHTACPLGQAACNGACIPMAQRVASFGLPGVHASPTGGVPTALAAVFADGDTIADLVVAETTSPSTYRLEILRGVGDGTFVPFQPASTVTLSSPATSIAVGDLNGDGVQDLVVGTGTDVLLLKGNGAGDFLAAGWPAIAAGPGPIAVALGDLNGDGILDLVVGDGPAATSANLRVFLNDGLATFGVAGALAGDPRLAHFTYDVLPDVRSVTIGPFDAQPGNDVLAVSATGGEVLRGSASGSLLQPMASGQKTLAFPLAVEPTAVVAANLDGFPGLDWAVASAAASTLRVFLNAGDGTAAWFERFDTLEPSGLAAADVNGDGRVDLVTADSPAGASWLHANLGPSFGAILFARPAILTAGDRPSAVAVVQVAGAPVVVTGNAGGPNLSAARRLSATTFAVPAAYPEDVSGTRPVNVDADLVALGHLDGDAWLDFAAVSALQNQLGVFVQTRSVPPAIRFAATASVALPLGAVPSALATGDLDGDGADDVVVALQGLDQVGILWGDGAGHLSPLEPHPVGASPAGVVVAQLDGRAGLDVATADSGANRVTLLTSSGWRTFAAPVVLPVGSRPAALVAADLDGRGCLDLVTANAGDGTLTLLRCSTTAPGTFAAPVPVPACAGAHALAVRRVGADPSPSVAVACADGVAVLRYLGGGSFAAGTVVGAGLKPVSIALGDLDGDGLADLAVASPPHGGVAVLRGTIQGFSPPEIYTAGGNPSGVAIARIDGDGQPDLLVAATRPTNVPAEAGAAFLQGTCAP